MFFCITSIVNLYIRDMRGLLFFLEIVLVYGGIPVFWIYLIQYIYFEITGKEETPGFLNFIIFVLIVSSFLLYHHFLASDSLKNYSPPSEPPRGDWYPG
mgnify:CR=1 FL=1